MDYETAEFQTQETLRQKRKKIKTMDDLITYLNYVKENYNCGYGDAPRAIAQAALATAWYLASDFGITGFQAGFVMWDFIRDWEYSHNKSGLKITDYDDMLYPQYGYKFDKTINPDTWASLQAQAAEELKNITFAADEVRKHWQSIVEGHIPFGYKVQED